MVAIELEASIVDHRIDVRSLQLPATARHARLIVLLDDHEAVKPADDILAVARAARASFPHHNPTILTQEMQAQRDEWGREL